MSTRMSENVPSSLTATDKLDDSNSSEDSSPEMEEDDFYVHERRTSINGVSSKAETLHTSIINQMEKDVLLEQVKENQSCAGMYEDKDNDIENTNDENTVNDQNGVVMQDAPTVPRPSTVQKYSNVNESEMERLINSEIVVAEMAINEESFVKILTLMIKDYPEYLKDYTIKSCKDSINFNMIFNQFIEKLEPVLQVHERLLKDFVRICRLWDSRQPSLAIVMHKHAEDLRLCESFLSKKAKLCQDFQLIIERNAEIQHATEQFEMEILNHPDVINNSHFEHMTYKPAETFKGMISIMKQWDMIHQNFFRYKAFMEKYQQFVHPAAVNEIAVIKLVLIKLNNVYGSMNSNFGETEENNFLNIISEKFQTLNFDVFLTGRSFIKEDKVVRQTRRDLAERQLILFNDTLFICHLDDPAIWRINLHKMVIEIDDGVERDKWFNLYSTKKSTAIKCLSKDERDSWVQEILQAQNQLRSSPKIFKPIEKKLEFSPLWVADDDATMCMMKDCACRFHLINRRHHCRKCGYVICESCSANALLLKGDSEASRVCPPCYDELFELLHNGKMPENIEVVNAESIRFSDGKETPIKELFKPPPSGKRIRGDDYSNKEKYIASGTIFTKSGTRYARLTADHDFFIYAARYDPIPAKHFNVQGCSYITTESPKDCRVHFKLSQQTGRKNSVVEFYVDEKCEPLWTLALNRLK